jgi:LysM repeat protein
MKKIFLFLFTCALLLNVSLFAQSVKYTLHTLAQGETLSMLAEKYKTTVGDIMRLNGMHADTKLAVGQKIKIPASGQTVVRGSETKPKPPVVKDTPPLTTPPAITKNVSSGLTHTVQPKETMYGISKKYGITVQQIQQWNNIKDYNLENGEVIAVSAKGVAEAAAKRKEQADTQSKAIAAVPDQTPPLVVSEPINVGKTAPEKTAVDVTAKENKADEEKKPAADMVTEQKQRPAINAAADGSDNFFAKNFGDEAPGKSTAIKSGISMIFKTASGWSDKKYYILMNDAPSGSIVKISAPNGNIVYAKVLWKLDDMKENKGIQFRISEAAAAALNVPGDKFSLTIQYYP